MRILGIAGSTRRGSHNRRLIRAAGDTLPSGGKALANEVTLTVELSLVEQQA